MATPPIYQSGTGNLYNSGSFNTPTSPLFSTPTYNPNSPLTLPKATSGVDINGQTLVGKPFTPRKVTTPVVSSNTAAKQATTVIQPTLTSAEQNIVDQRAAVAAQNANGTTATTPEKPKSTKTPEQQILEEPEDGMQNIYNSYTGEKQEIPDGATIPHGFSSKNPTERTDVMNSVVDEYGNTYKRFSDGTYGRFDPEGNYIGSNETSYNNVVEQNSLKQKIDQVARGVYPLTADQQAQIDSVKTQFDSLLKQQEQINADSTGANTIAQNLYGMGNTITGKGEITRVMNAGLDKVIELQAKASEAVSKMRIAFQQDNMTMLKQAYDIYKGSTDAIQQNVDSINQSMQNTKDKIDTKNREYAISQSSKYQDTEEPILPSDSPTEVNRKVKTSPTWQYEQKTKSGSVDQSTLNGMIDSYKTTGSVPNFGYSAAGNALRTAFWAAIGGDTGAIGQASQNKAAISAATKALGTQQNLRSSTEASVSTLDKTLDLASQYSKKVDRSGSPLLARYALFLKGQATGDADTAAFQALMKTAANEYAKIMSGSTASISGVTVSSAADAEEFINAKLSQGQFDAVRSILEKDAQYRLQGYDTAIKSINQNIQDIASSATDDKPSQSSGGTPSSFAEDW